jgi:carboxylesterase
MSLTFSLNHRKAILNAKLNSVSKNGLFFPGNNGNTVILIHGLTGTPFEMKFLAAFLNKKGYSVICPRLANHGEPLEVLKATRWQEFYQSIRQTFVEIKENNNLIFAAGLSMGALLGLLLAEEFPERVSGVTCLSPTLFYDGWNMPWYRFFIPLAYATPLKYFFYFKEDYPYGIKNEAIRQYVQGYYTQARLSDIEKVDQYGYPYFPLTLLYQLQLLIKFLKPKLKNIRTPTQFIQAKDDDMTSLKNSQYLYDRIKSPDKEMVILYDSYHVITADQERGKVAESMERFFQRIAGGSNRIKYKEVSKDA